MRQALPFHALTLAIALAAASASGSGGQGIAAVRPGELLASLEQETHAKVNAYRASRGLAALAWNESIAEQARRHSRNMAKGTAGFGHDGFDTRAHDRVKMVPWSSVGENVFMLLNLPDPAAVAVAGWVDSEGHRENIEGDFDQTGVGVARASDGSLYFTQIFIKSKQPHR